MPPAAPPRKDKTGTIILVIILAFVGMCVLGAMIFAWFGFNAAKTVMPQAMAFAACEVNYEAVHESLKEYADEHGGKLPPAATWQDELRPYVKKRLDKVRAGMTDAPDFVKMEPMNPDGDWGCDFGEGGPKTGMAFNKDFGGKKIDEIKSKDTDILIFETKTRAKNQALKYEAQPYADSPKIMGAERGWIVITWAGGSQSVSKDGSLSDVNFETGSSSGGFGTGQ